MEQKIGMNEILDSLSYKDLLQLRFDIANDAEYLQKLVNTKIAKLEYTPRNVCAHCATNIESQSNSQMTLLFGPSDFRKKATFCGQDCLEMFLFNLRQIKQKHTIRSERL